MLENRGAIFRLEPVSLFTFGSRSRAATAAFLSSLFPGAGQAYNRQWLKAAATAVVALSLLFAIAAALASVLAAAGAGLAGAADVLTPEAMERQLLPAMVNENVLADIRSRVLPPAVLLLAVGLWSMIDGYRVARRQTAPRSTSGSPHLE